MIIISLELTRVNPDRNIFSINVELTSTFLLYRVLSITITEFKSLLLLLDAGELVVWRLLQEGDLYVVLGTPHRGE